jgi:hypothetical protein
MDGFILHHPYMVNTKNKAIISPGIIPARNNLPIDCSVMMPSTMRVTLGGMSMPSVPTVATIPVESFLLYPYLSIMGTAILAKVAAVAGEDPQIALKAVAPPTVAMASPLEHGQEIYTRYRTIFFAIPEWNAT